MWTYFFNINQIGQKIVKLSEHLILHLLAVQEGIYDKFWIHFLGQN